MPGTAAATILGVLVLTAEAALLWTARHFGWPDDLVMLGVVTILCVPAIAGGIWAMTSPAAAADGGATYPRSD